jgi:hypothetical protein
MLQQHLQQTHLAASDQLIRDQRALIAILEERGHDTAAAKRVLARSSGTGADARLTPPQPAAPPSAPKMISTLKK